jgi:hypothetical protein
LTLGFLQKRSDHLSARNRVTAHCAISFRNPAAGTVPLNRSLLSVLPGAPPFAHDKRTKHQSSFLS